MEHIPPGPQIYAYTIGKMPKMPKMSKVPKIKNYQNNFANDF